MLLTFEQFKTFEPKRETFALFGFPLGHTMSPELHAQLFAVTGRKADYIGVSVPPENLEEAISIARVKLAGINLTIPHKKTVIGLLDAVDKSALDLGSVNTVNFANGEAIGYNTDILGFAETLERDDICLRGTKVLLLGYGGAAAVMAYHCVNEGAHLIISGRNIEKASQLRKQLLSFFPNADIEACALHKIPKDIQIVINGTPLGMFPNEDSSPLVYLPNKTFYVFDAVYNPPMTALMKLARPQYTKARDGLFMLVMQAARAQTIWYGAQFSEASCDQILRRLYGKMAAKRLQEKHNKQNIVLCGFMGSGKTTVGRKLARLTGLNFVDVDQYLEQQEGKKISDIFAEFGETYFRDLETKYVRELCSHSGQVIALGGGAVLREENVTAIKSTGLLILLDTPFNRIVKNLSYSSNRPLLENGDKMAETRRLYQQRKDIYRKAADRTVRSSRLSETVQKALTSI